MFGFGKKKEDPAIIDQKAGDPEGQTISVKLNDLPPNDQNQFPKTDQNPGTGFNGEGPENKPQQEKKGFFSKVGDVFEKGYEATKKGVNNLAGKAKQGFENIADKTAEVGGKVAENKFVKKYGIDVYNDTKEMVSTLKNDIIRDLKNSQYFKQMKFKINRFVILKLEKIIEKQLFNLANKIKKATDDPDMPNWIKGFKDDLIDEFYPDLKDEIMFMLKIEVSQPYLDMEEPTKLCCLLQGARAFRAWVLYSLDPVDLTIWKRMKTFSFWFLQLVQNFPFYGVQTFFLLFYFLLMCKSDEYQLVNFIVTFKKLQFFTIGCLGGLISYAQYFFCISTDNGLVGYYEVNRCAKRSDGDPLTYWIEIGTFFLKILLVWSCYLLLPCSSRLGMPTFRIQHNKEKDRQEKEERRCCNCSRGGRRLRILMYWELFASILTVLIYFILTILVIKNDKVSKRESVYFCQVLYGLLSFPFLVFSVPLMTTLLTRTRDTKYDKYGRCVPDIPSLYKIKEKEKLRDDEIKRQNGLHHKGEPDEELQDFQGLLNDEGADLFEEIDALQEDELVIRPPVALQVDLNSKYQMTPNPQY